MLYIPFTILFFNEKLTTLKRGMKLHPLLILNYSLYYTEQIRCIYFIFETREI